MGIMINLMFDFIGKLGKTVVALDSPWGAIPGVVVAESAAEAVARARP